MNPILKAEGVSYRYPGTESPALKDLELQIPAGKKVAICGHNGSGKSTFFLHAVGIHRPASGSILWQGEPIVYRHAELRQLRQRIGLVFQDPEQQLILSTPYEDISYGLRNAGIGEAEIRRRTDRILASMRLEPLADKPMHHLSLGQKKRVALAGVLVLEPELLMLDEPTAYLDRSSEQQLVEELDRIHAGGMTVVMATHDMNLAYAWADWLLVLDRGACVLEGTPYEVFSRNKERMDSLGLEQPMLLELWESLPERLRKDNTPLRHLSDFKDLLSGL